MLEWLADNASFFPILNLEKRAISLGQICQKEKYESFCDTAEDGKLMKHRAFYILRKAKIEPFTPDYGVQFRFSIPYPAAHVLGSRLVAVCNVSVSRDHYGETGGDLPFKKKAVPFVLEWRFRTHLS